MGVCLRLPPATRTHTADARGHGRVQALAHAPPHTPGAMGSLGYRLSEIERAVPYQDVRPAWAKNSRHSWVVKTFKQANSASKLAELTLELLDALTPSCIKYLWPEDEDGFSKMRETLLKVSSSKGKDASIKNTLASVRAKNGPPDLLHTTLNCAAGRTHY